MNPWTEYDKGWLSALIDADGSLSLLKDKRPRNLIGYGYKPRVNIGNTKVAILEKAQSLLGGAIIKHPEKFREDRGWSPFYNLDISANNLRIALPQLRFVIKERQRILLIRALEILARHKGKGNPRTQEELDELELIYLEIRKLNNRVWNK